MWNRWTALLGLLLLAACTAPEQPSDPSRFVATAPPVPVDQRLSSELRSLLAQSTAEREIRVLVELRDQTDFAGLGKSLALRGLNREQRRSSVVRALRALSNNSAGELRTYLERLRERGLITSYRHYTIVNGLVVAGSAQGIQQLSRHEKIARIVEETDLPLSQAVSETDTAHAPADRWPLTMIGAAEGWSAGLSGRGVVVGIIDAGASAIHEQLRANFRGGPHSWFDPSGLTPQPQDETTGHGTGVLSCAVGQNVGSIAVGVAPRARWIACVGLPRRRYNNIAMTDCADWMLTTGQPDILLNPWVLETAAGCDRSLERIVNAWRAAEILPIFAAGNEGPRPSTDASPANYVDLYPGGARSLSVGAIGRDQQVLPKSSRGPNRCDGSTYPSLVAPGLDVPAAFPAGSSTYLQARGTSYSAGYVGGAAALMLERFPEASVWQIEEALRSSATELGPAGPDHTFGYGLLNIPAALNRLAAQSRPAQTPGPALTPGRPDARSEN